MTNLAQFEINGTNPFWSPADSADECLSQASALITLLAGAHEVCEQVSADEADAFVNIRHHITGRALSGIGSLIALALHQQDVAREDRADKASAAKWREKRDAYLTAATAVAAQGRNLAAFGTPDCEAHEAETLKLSTAQAEAFDAMMLEPAPNAAALAFKLRAFNEMQAFDGWDNGGTIAAQLSADADRFAS
ncbi:MAG: hypothetical protein COW16_07140 [Sphingomonadales bacterium CG12_big_fil_rev_8_21_14_0_65_65_10]|nr:MAG: hypothetical protein COW16_07140 [Sphingomonadales bacterium CG12_big_fil_rev_8_21_14_0_65_65_10]